MNLTSNDLICKWIEFYSGKNGHILFPAESSDPIVKLYLNGRSPNEYVISIIKELTLPGDLIMDVGCHLGTVAIGAGLSGRRVLGVDANPLHVDLIRKSAAINKLTDFEVIHCAVSTKPNPISFIANGLFGAIDFTGQWKDTIEVPTMQLDEIVALHAKNARVRFIKMDIEGAEYEALLTGSRILKEDQPAIWWESNGPTLRNAGRTIAEMRTLLESHGYRTFRIEGNQWVYAPPSQIQPESWVDMLSLSERDQKKWSDKIRWDWNTEEMLERAKTWSTVQDSVILNNLLQEIDQHEKPELFNFVREQVHQTILTLKRPGG